MRLSFVAAEVRDELDGDEWKRDERERQEEERKVVAVQQVI